MIPAGAGPGEGIWPASRQLASLALRSGAVVAAATQPAAGGSPPRTPRAGSPVSGPASRMWLEVAAGAGHGDAQPRPVAWSRALGPLQISLAVRLDLAAVVRARSRRCHAVGPGGSQPDHQLRRSARSLARHDRRCTDHTSTTGIPAHRARAAAAAPARSPLEKSSSIGDSAHLRTASPSLAKASR